MENKLETIEKNSNITPLIYSTFDYDKRIKMRSELEMLFNRFGIDNELNVPDFILAEAVDNYIMIMYNTNKAINKLINGNQD